ncbi:Hypothetical predicted protein [Olea europaea subsp. europaea]|uniref:Uncharacterized protein n=1 Tax=Olea europaea subsp. europaea TaxID=158383 RepID=A0A8S0TJ78_OLEEU|nr:Hypothetical predicted protein [Olea europaea subsp. europaea]
MELVSDVQLMLKWGMQYYGLSSEVRSEARKVHNLFFDILKIAFPDTDFQEAKNSVSFFSPLSTPALGSSSRRVHAGQNKRQKLVKGVNSDPVPLQKSQSRVSVQTVEDPKVRSIMPQKELILGSSSGRDLSQPGEPLTLTHPGDLVICKKKRKDREKTSVKLGKGSAGPVFPAGLIRNIQSTGLNSGGKDVGFRQQNTQQGWAALSPRPGNSGRIGSTVGWANPVKRTRTDARRRPSQL